MEENAAETYYRKLSGATNPATILCDFYKTITGRPWGRSEIIMFNKLIKIFGRYTVFFAVLDLANVQALSAYPYRLLFTICKNRLEKINQVDLTSATSTNLNKSAGAIEKEIEKLKKTKKVVHNIIEEMENEDDRHD
jgi:hypothetical protein